MHLYEISTTDGRTLMQWADGPWEACAMLGVAHDQIADVRMLA